MYAVNLVKMVEKNKIIGVWEVEKKLECEEEEKNESQGAREGIWAIWYSWVPFGTGSC